MLHGTKYPFFSRKLVCLVQYSTRKKLEECSLSPYWHLLPQFCQLKLSWEGFRKHADFIITCQVTTSLSTVIFKWHLFTITSMVQSLKQGKKLNYFMITKKTEAETTQFPYPEFQLFPNNTYLKGNLYKLYFFTE